jgi:hypothetical protein
MTALALITTDALLKICFKTPLSSILLITILTLKLPCLKLRNRGIKPVIIILLKIRLKTALPQITLIANVMEITIEDHT